MTILTFLLMVFRKIYSHSLGKATVVGQFHLSGIDDHRGKGSLNHIGGT
jgi:hypothetical protein